MQEAPPTWSRARFVAAVIFSLLLLAAVLPSTGAIMETPRTHSKMWRFGPFLFYPKSFFMVTAAVTAATGCTLYGICRQNWVEWLGWILLGVCCVLFLPR